jgi:hypothetical protein
VRKRVCHLEAVVTLLIEEINNPSQITRIATNNQKCNGLKREPLRKRIPKLKTLQMSRLKKTRVIIVRKLKTRRRS